MAPDEDSRTVALYFELDRLGVHFYLPHFGLLAHQLEDLLEDYRRLTALLLGIGALARRRRGGFAVALVAGVGGRRRRAGRARVDPAAPMIPAPAAPPLRRAFVARRRRRLRSLGDLRDRI